MSGVDTGPDTAGEHRIFLAMVMLVGLSLRPFITGIGPLAGPIGAETGLGLTGLSLLTLIPILLMGAMAFAAPPLRARFGEQRLMLAALAVLALGSGLRFWAGQGWQLVLTAALLGLGAAMIQALFPGIVKARFPLRTGLMMGLYSGMLMGGGALGARLAPLITGVTGSWHLGLGWMAVLPVLGLLLARRALPAAGRTGGKASEHASLMARPRIWLLMLCFGLVNGGYSSVVAWLAPFYQERGQTAGQSGSLLAVLALSQAMAALSLPVLAGRGPDRRGWIWLTLAMQAAGFLGLVLWPDLHPWLLAGILGAGLGGCFSLSMIVALEHAADAGRAGAISALMQGGGFLIAAQPPFVLAELHRMTGSFAPGWALHLACVAVVAGLVLRLEPQGYARALRASGTGPGAAAQRHPRPICPDTSRPL